MAPSEPAPPRHHRWSIPLGHIAGIPIRVHATFFLLPLLFVTPGEPLGVFAAALGWIVVIFAAVVVHELAHSLVGRRHGAVVEDILLLPIGGVSQMHDLPVTPRDEFAMAVVGPLASFGLAAGAAVVAAALGVPLWPATLVAGPVLARFVWFNVLLGAFNLLPAFPMDGGRVLRSWLARHHDLETATRRAASVGRAAGIVFIGVGFVYDLWLTLIGFFVLFGAEAEAQATILRLRTGRGTPEEDPDRAREPVRPGAHGG